MDLDFTTNLITRHEGFRAICYKDSRGFLTIGIGFNLDAPAAEETCTALGLNYNGLRNGNSITEAQAQAVLDGQIKNAIYAAQCQFPNWDTLPDKVQAVVIDMIFNLGSDGFAKFRHMITALRCFDYPEAAAQMRTSLWYKQVGLRAIEDVALMEAA